MLAAGWQSWSDADDYTERAGDRGRGTVRRVLDECARPLLGGPGRPAPGRGGPLRGGSTGPSLLRPLLTHLQPVVSMQALLELAHPTSSYCYTLGPGRYSWRPGYRPAPLRSWASLPSRPSSCGSSSTRWPVSPSAPPPSTAELRLPLLPTHLSFREMGERLQVSCHTVKTHVTSIYRKLGVSSRTEAIERMEVLGLHGAS